MPTSWGGGFDIAAASTPSPPARNAVSSGTRDFCPVPNRLNRRRSAGGSGSRRTNHRDRPIGKEAKNNALGRQGGEGLADTDDRGRSACDGGVGRCKRGLGLRRVGVDALGIISG